MRHPISATGLPKFARAFTLIELLLVIAIAGILAGISIPAIQDYVMRTRVVEGISLSTSAKTAVAEYLITHGGTPPENNAEAGLPETISSPRVSGITVGNGGVITITFSEKAGLALAGATLLYTPHFENGAISWDCINGGTVPANFRPVDCR